MSDRAAFSLSAALVVAALLLAMAIAQTAPPRFEVVGGDARSAFRVDRVTGNAQFYDQTGWREVPEAQRRQVDDDLPGVPLYGVPLN